MIHRLVGASEFLGKMFKGGEMLADDGEIAARQGTGPSGARSEPLKILQYLTGQRQESADGEAALHAHGDEHPCGGFHKSEHAAGGHGARSVVERFRRTVYRDGTGAKAARNAARDAHRGGITLDGEDFSFERGNSHAAERLQRMHRANSGSAIFQGIERARTDGAARLQNNFALKFFSADAREFGGDLCEDAIGRGDQDYLRGEDVAREASVRAARANGTNGFASAGFAARDDGPDFPS